MSAVRATAVELVRWAAGAPPAPPEVPGSLDRPAAASPTAGVTPAGTPPAWRFRAFSEPKRHMLSEAFARVRRSRARRSDGLLCTPPHPLPAGGRAAAGRRRPVMKRVV